MEYIKYPKTQRWSDSRKITITEKIDGTNAQVWITDEGEVIAGSRNRIITPDDDNYGFARWVEENKEELKKLGKGRHYGEWWGAGIQKNRYGVEGKHFSIFNTFRPVESLPECVNQVPILYEGELDDDVINQVFDLLKINGSHLGGDNPEGIIIYVHSERKPYKMTYDYKNGKWGDK